ncbi:hypothetical protein [Mesorhizobium sp.]|uniref:hypothetical protein n=1 Tax=Mesorhizobium sp. TaxID=1871066 RepID=UPI0025E6D6DF|nr:hypothetical protein [Mesorhizobium sp.]
MIAAGALPKVSHGQGGYVFDADGKQYIDGSGGLPFTASAMAMKKSSRPFTISSNA